MRAKNGNETRTERAERQKTNRRKEGWSMTVWQASCCASPDLVNSLAM